MSRWAFALWVSPWMGPPTSNYFPPSIVNIACTCGYTSSTNTHWVIAYSIFKTQIIYENY